MEIVIIDDNGKKICIDTNHPQHARVRNAVAFHATELSKLVNTSLLEYRMLQEKEARVVRGAGQTVCEVEGVVEATFFRD
jgi:hypothetical protein